MDILRWEYDGQQYVLGTKYGKAIIVEVPDETKAQVIGAADHNKYVPRLELTDGTVRAPVRIREFDDFESAEGYLLYHELAPLATASDLSQTVATCADLLAASDSHPTHLQRLRFVAKTLELTEPSLTANSKLDEKEPETDELSWQQSGSRYSAATRHGTVIIIEKLGFKSRRYGGSDSYKPALDHDTGAVLRGPRFYTFEAAETWLVLALQQLDHPTGGKDDVGSVSFTLDICIKLLPEDSDPAHYVHIRRMQAEFSDLIL